MQWNLSNKMNTSYYFFRVARLQIVTCFVLIWRAKLCKEVLSTDVRIHIIKHMILMCWVILFNTFKTCNKTINNLLVHIHTDVCHFLNAYLSCQLPCHETIIDTEEVNVWSRLVQGVELDCSYYWAREVRVIINDKCGYFRFIPTGIQQPKIKNTALIFGIVWNIIINRGYQTDTIT